MKRITINLDLDENELLAEEVRRAIRDCAREIARSEFDKEINKEIERLAKVVIANGLKEPERWACPKGGEIYQKINDVVTKTLCNKDAVDIPTLVNAVLAHKADIKNERQVEDMVNKAVDSMKADVLRSVKDVLKNELFKG